MTQYFTSLSRRLINKFGNRKVPGRVSVVVDVDTKKIYPVPRTIEHIDFVRQIFFGSEEVCGERLSRYIPSHVDIEPTDNNSGDAIGIITGVSGLEISYGARHLVKDLYSAHGMVKEFVERGDVHLRDSLLEDIVVERYALQD